MSELLHTCRNTRIRIPRGTVVRVLDTLPNADNPSEPDGLGTFDTELMEDLEVNVANSIPVMKKDT